MATNFFNTVGLSGLRLEVATEVANIQEQRILTIMRAGCNYTPFKVHDLYSKKHPTIPITSIRRAMTCLTDKGLIDKMPTQKEERLGMPNHVWQKPTTGKKKMQERFNKSKASTKKANSTKPQRVYLSGQISGLDEWYARLLFEEAEYNLTTLGYIPINPMKLNHNHDRSWEEFMRVDIQALCDCDSIFMLENWTKSRGATTEKKLAKLLGMTILYQ